MQYTSDPLFNSQVANDIESNRHNTMQLCASNSAATLNINQSISYYAFLKQSEVIGHIFLVAQALSEFSFARVTNPSTILPAGVRVPVYTGRRSRLVTNDVNIEIWSDITGGPPIYEPIIPSFPIANFVPIDFKDFSLAPGEVYRLRITCVGSSQSRTAFLFKFYEYPSNEILRAYFNEIDEGNF